MLDGTQAAKQILDLILDTGQIFGQAHIIDVLRGANTEKVRKFRHNQLKLYGIGSDIDKNTCRTILRQMVAGGYLSLDVAGYGGLSLHPKGQEVIDGSRVFSYRSDVIKLATKRKHKISKKIVPNKLNIEQDELLAVLKEKRTELARKRRVPPYMIFSDRSLEDMALSQPTDETAFSKVHGVGVAKLKEFALDFIGVVNSFICK